MSDFDGKIEFEKFPPAYRLMIKYTELENRINKAIEYLKENACYDDGEFCRDLIYYECKELLDILKGSDSNETK